MTESDVSALIGYFLSSFGVGMISAILLRIFRRAAGFVR